MLDDEFLARFRHTITRTSAELRQLTDEQASAPVGPGQWSRKQILGHLIDSAANNHARFIRAQMQDDLIFERYDQDAWVHIQQYNSCSWLSLLQLWTAYNYHLAHVMTTAEQLSVERPRSRHNHDEIGYRRVPRNKLITLEDLMRDYVAHLEHHLEQARAM